MVILADINIQGQIDVIIEILKSSEWIEFWDALELSYVHFKDVALGENAADTDIWRLCEANGYLLITSNRNEDTPDSLETAIRSFGTSASLPVLTVSDPKRLQRDRDYAGRVVVSLLQILLEVDSYRGTGRLYLP